MSNPVTGCLPLLASVDFQSPVLWAVVVGWILSVTLHELAHGVVAYLGGDYTIRERGGLTLNPLKYMDPLLSIALPLFFLLQGGVPLPGGVTYVRRDLLRTPLWATAVSLAGPAVNFLLFLLLALAFHPKIGWIHPSPIVEEWTSTQLFMAAMAKLQFEVFIINLLPIPPLDGFGAIMPYFDAKTQAVFSSRQVAYAGFFLLSFVILQNSVMQGIYHLGSSTLYHLGFDDPTVEQMRQAFNKVLFNQ